MKYLHEKVKHKLEQSNQKYKDSANRSRRHKNFEVGDEVMIHLKKFKFSIGMYSKLNIKKFDSCKVFRRFDSGNAYEVKLLDDMGISPIFNVVDFYEYYEFDEEIVVLSDHPKKQMEEVENILSK